MNNSIKINIMKNLFKVFACSIALFSMSAMTGCDNGDVYIYESSDLTGQRPSISIDTPSVSIAKFGKRPELGSRSPFFGNRQRIG